MCGNRTIIQMSVKTVANAGENQGGVGLIIVINICLPFSLPRQRVNVYNANVPTRTIVSSLMQSKHNQFVEFTNSGMDADAAQSTVPFIDIQEVVSSPPVPLAGIGLYYKGRPGYGGFVAPKIITYDFTPHVQMPKNLS